MITIFFRSSSLGAWEYCKAKYFLVYVLGLEEASNKKAEKGTIAHKALEVAAILKKLFDETDNCVVSYEDEHIGLVTATREEFFKITTLNEEEVLKINKSRKSKTIYKHECNLDLDHERMGAIFMNKIIKRCYDHYSKRSAHSWDHLDYRDCWNWSWMGMEANNGMYDPRKRIIKDPERKFEIEIKEDWAKYKFFYNNKWLEGNLALKGTIDLVTKIDDNTLEIIDWKTGQRRNWAKNEEKNLDDFYEDTQLMMYYYAARLVYPDYKNIMLTINYIRDGGAYTVCFDDDTIIEVKKRIAKKFEEIKKSENIEFLDPTYKDFRCKTLCPFFKDQKNGKPLCLRIKENIDEFGIDYVSENYKREDFILGTYASPGE